MSTSQKLWLGFGTLTALVVFLSVAILLRVQSIEGLVHEQANVARPRSATAQQLEIDILGYALNVHAFLRNGDPVARRTAASDAANVERDLAEYTHFAVTEYQQKLAARAAMLWHDFKGVAEIVLQAENHRPKEEDFKKFYELRTAIEDFLDREIQVDAIENYNASRDETFRDVKAILSFVLILLVVGVVICVMTSVAVGRAVVMSEQALAEQGERLRTTLASIGDAVITTDETGRITNMNAVAEHLTAWKNAEALGQPLDAVFHIVNEETRQVVDNPATRALREGIIVGLANHTVLIGKDGTERFIDDSAAPIRCKDGEMVGCVLIFRDIAERKLAELKLQQSLDTLEERVRERTAELGKSMEALTRSNQELEQFASIASHDLQEPLRKIQAFGDRLQAKFAPALGETGHEYLDRILDSAGRMRTLINDLLAFSRVATKAQPFVPTSLAVVAQEVVSDLEGRLQQTGGSVELDELATIDADPLQMRQLLMNLIGNGLKFHRPDTPPIVRVRGRLIAAEKIAYNESTSSVPLYEISVEDNGIGFEEVYLDRIFEVFQRLHGRNEYEGTGMGLAICRKIVQRHGGQITATSAPGEGATFFVTLPVRRLSEENNR